MLTEINFKTRLTRITYLIGQVIFFMIILIISEKITCPFKKLFHIPCPFCGMTRSFHSLTHLKIKESITYNILLIPLLITIIIIDIIFLYEIINNKEITLKIKNKRNKIIVIITLLLILSIIWGIIHRI